MRFDRHHDPVRLRVTWTRLTCFSARSRSVLSAVIVFAALLCVRPCAGDVRPLITRPNVPRGGVMMIPVALSRDAQAWPDTCPLTLADGRMAQGRIVWIGGPPESPPASGPRPWTAEPLGLRVTDASEAPPDSAQGLAYVVAPLPADADGPIELGGRTLEPIWWTLPPSSDGQAAMTAEQRPDRPDPTAPTEHWRWAVLADRLGLAPPSLDRFDEPAALVARHQTALWRAGLARLAAVSPGVAATCRDLLTEVADGRGDGPAFAVWIASSSATNALLEMLLDPRLTADRLVTAALGWADAQPPWWTWTASADGRLVHLAWLNRRRQPAIVRAQWLDAEDLPLALRAEPSGLSYVAVDRPPPPPIDQLTGTRPPEPDRRTLRLVGDGHRVDLTFGPPARDVTPPAAVLPPFQSALALADVQAGLTPLAPLTRATAVQIRRRAGRWEAFFECRRPGSSAPNTLAADTDDWREAARGREAVALLIGPAGDATTILLVPEQGAHVVVKGSASSALAVHQMSHDDRWLCRIVLPDAWLPDPSELDPATGRAVPLTVGAARFHADTTNVETSPHTGPPWAQHPGRVAVFLDAWDAALR